MKTTLAVLALLVVAVGTVYTQAPPLPSRNDQPRLPTANDPNFGNLIPAPAQPSQPTERSVNQLLDDIQKIRVQKAELEKREQALIAEVRKLLAQQTERLNKMGLGVPIEPLPAVDFTAPAPLTPGAALPVPGNAPFGLPSAPGTAPPAPQNVPPGYSVG